MFRLLSPSLGRGLLRAAGRRCRGCSAHLPPGPAGGRAPEAEAPPLRVAPQGGGPGLLPLLAGEGGGRGGSSGGARGAGRAGDLRALSAALAWFSRPAGAEEEEEPGAGGAAGEAADEAEAEIIRLLKRAKVRRPVGARPRLLFAEARWRPEGEVPGKAGVVGGPGGVGTLRARQPLQPPVRPLQAPQASFF